MSKDASFVTERNRQRALFASKVLEDTRFNNTVKNTIQYEGPQPNTMSYEPHYYKMKTGAYFTSVEEYNSYIASIPTVLPGPPTNASALGGNAQATVSFTAPSGNFLTPVVSYTVISNPGNIRATGSGSPITVTGLTNGLTYTFTVIATNSGGNSVESVATAPITLGAAPSAPTSLTLTSSTSSTLTITFTAGFNGGFTITNYEYSTDDGNTYTPFNPVDTTSPVILTGLTASTTYPVKLRAVNTLGPGAESATLSVSTQAPPAAPGAPTLTLALADDSAVYIYFNVGTGSVENYEYSTDNGTTFTELSVADSIAPIRIASLTNGTTYNIKLKAKNIGGTSIESNMIQATPVAPSVASAVLNYNIRDSDSYPGTGNTLSNIGTFGLLNGTKTSDITYNSNVKGGVLDFPGTTGDVITFPSYNFGNTISCTAWIFPRATSNINGLLANTVANQSPNGFKFQWNTWLTNSRVLSMEAGNGSAGGTNITVTNTIVYNTWQHVGYVFDKVNRTVIFFLNGVPVDMLTTITPVANINTSAEFNIGGFRDGTYTMNAQLGYIKVFNTLLNATQIYADYNTSRSIYL